jgi:cytochrome c oxidase subunit 3
MASTTLIPAEPKPLDGGNGRGRDINDYRDGGSGGDGRRDEHRDDASARARACRTGMWVALAAIVMLFASLTSALVVRRGWSSDWRPTHLPGVLWINTAILVASSVTLSRSRRLHSAGRVERFAVWWYATTGLGLAFIVGQWIAWRELAARGIYLASNPSSSFFYLLTAAHGLHLVGGIAGLFYVSTLNHRHRFSKTAVDVTAIYWHFMDGLWLYLFLLLNAGGWF